MNLDERCPRCGEISSTPDLCSECGASMTPRPSVDTHANPVSSTVVADVLVTNAVEMDCPVCREHRTSLQDRFCGTCRYDYVLKKPFEEMVTPALIAVIIPTTTEFSTPSPLSNNLQATSVTATNTTVTNGGQSLDLGAMPIRLMRWEAVAVADPSLCELGTEIPSDIRERVFPIDFSENLIGRRTGGTGVRPEISIVDHGVSKRHARIDRAPDGSLSLVDLDSTNGTKLNGASLEPNLPVPLGDGDVVLLGAYTRMIIKGR